MIWNNEGLHSHGSTPIAGWFIWWKFPSTWMMNRGTPILGNAQLLHKKKCSSTETEVRWVRCQPQFLKKNSYHLIQTTDVSPKQIWRKKTEASKRAPDPPSPKPPYTSTWRIHLFCIHIHVISYIIYIYILYYCNSSDSPQWTNNKMTFLRIWYIILRDF